MKQVITANTLKTGEVVFLGGHDWVTCIDDATLYDHDADLNHEIARHSTPDHVIGVYAIAVDTDDGIITPRHIREKIRTLGPGNYNHRRGGDTAPMKRRSTG